MIGTSSVQLNVRQSLKEAGPQLNDLLVVKQLPFVREGRVKESEEIWAVVCEDLEELQTRILAKFDDRNQSSCHQAWSGRRRRIF